MSGIRRYLEFIGNVGLFALRSARRAFIPPFEFMMIWRQIESVGWQSLPLVISSGLALGIVLNFGPRGRTFFDRFQILGRERSWPVEVVEKSGLGRGSVTELGLGKKFQHRCCK